MGRAHPQQNSLGMYGSPGLHRNARPVGRIGTAIRNSSPTLFPVLRTALFPTGLHISTAYQREKQDARRYYDDGDRIQPAEWLYTRYVDILPLPRKYVFYPMADYTAVHHRNNPVLCRHVDQLAIGLHRPPSP